MLTYQHKPVSLNPEGVALAGEIRLEVLLKKISPVLRDGEYVFCTMKDAHYGDFSDTKPLAAFIEDEGLSLVLSKEAAESSGLSYDGVFRCITLGVHSSLEAVGLTAAVATDLASHGIAANVVAAYFHDHVFVQSEYANRAIDILSRYSET